MLICKDGCGTHNPDTATQCQGCQRSLRSALRLYNPGTLVRHYRIGQIIGWGGFGAVYKAEDARQPGSRVALKESLDPSGMTSFQAEFAALQQHPHPHLPRYEAMFVEQGNGYLVMEFIPGQNLEEVLKSEPGPLPEAQVLSFAVQLCEVLGYLHRQSPPIIHRDIKPANIRLTPSGRVKLVDFGLFKQGTDTTQSSRRGLTTEYAPLEQYHFTAGHTDQRSDIYSLGATFYHLLTGQLPETSIDRTATISDPLVPPAHLNPRLSPHVAAAITKALNLAMTERYQDIASFRQALLGQAPVVSVPPPKPARAPQAKPTPAPPPKPTPAPPPKPAPAPPPKPAPAPQAKPAPAPPPKPAPAPQVKPTPAPQAKPTPAPQAKPAPAPQVKPAYVAAPTLPLWVPEMVEVPAGPFLMGNSDWDKDAQSNEKPQHTLTLPRYEIGKTPVTNFQFRPFVEGDGYTNRAYWDDEGWQWHEQAKRTQPSYWRDATWNGDRQPVIGVTWYEANAYTRWLSAQTGMTFQLPTEAMWEKAARGTDGRIYPWGNTWYSKRANSRESSLGKTTPVGQYPNGASPYGALDMAGNVWQWTASIYRPYPYDPTDGRENSSYYSARQYFTLRGGSWTHESLSLRVAYRLGDSPSYPFVFPNVGMRLARLLPAQTQLAPPPQAPVARAPQPQAKPTLPVWMPEMVEVPAGSFLMGSNDRDQDAQSDEKPRHTLTLPRYAIGKTPVTNAQFRPFVAGDGYTNRAYWDDAGWQWREQARRTQPSSWHDAKWNSDLQPVVDITWHEALAYTRWLNAQTDMNFQLPTEAMWEKAARGTDGRIYPWGNTWEAGRANSREAGLGKTTPVGQYPNGTSRYGARDMAGNVWEWTASMYRPYPYNPTDGREILSALVEKPFTVRGGSWNDASLSLRAAYRHFFSPGNVYRILGFRLARWLPSA